MTPELKKLLNSSLKKSPHIFQDVKKAGVLHKIPLDSPQMNYLFGGGITVGRIHRFRGPESSGKSTICNYLAGQLQLKLPTSGIYGTNPNQKIAVYVDWEHTFDMIHATENGLDCSEDNFIYMTPDSIEDYTDTIIPLIETGEIAAIIFDSDAASTTKAMWVDAAGKATFGGLAKALGESIRKLNAKCANHKVTQFWISQERVNMQPMSHLPVCTGGEAPKFFSSTVNRVTKIEELKENDDVAGIKMRVRNYKNKCGRPFRTAEVNLYYKGGFNPNEEYLQFLVDLGIVEQRGAYFKSDEFGFNLQGRAKLQEWLNTHDEEYTGLKKKVDESLLGTTVLDKNNESVSEDIDYKALKDEVGEIPDTMLEETE